MAALKVLYLLILGLALFVPPLPLVMRDWGPLWHSVGFWTLAAGGALQIGVALGLNVAGSSLRTTLRRSAIFLVALVLAYGLPTGPQGSWAGLQEGVWTAARLAILLWATAAIQQGSDPGELVAGLKSLGLPENTALTVDVTLALITGGPGGGRRGHGGGRGNGGGRSGRDDARGPEAAPRAWARIGFWLREVRHLGPNALLEPLRRFEDQAAARLEVLAPQLSEPAVRDLSTIIGLAVLAQTIRFLRILPGVPFLPGHKSVILIPLYLAAAAWTSSRWGATAMGTTAGFVNFALGGGRFGPFEIVKFVAPGLVADLAGPLLGRLRGSSFALLGVVVATARLGAVLAVAWLVHAPPLFWTFVAPMAIFHLGFGALSGAVSQRLLAFSPESLVPATERTPSDGTYSPR